MIRANVAEVKARLSHYLRLAKDGETVEICERNIPVAKMTAIKPPVDIERRRASMGMFQSKMTPEELDEALGPMRDEK